MDKLAFIFPILLSPDRKFIMLLTQYNKSLFSHDNYIIYNKKKTLQDS